MDEKGWWRRVLVAGTVLITTASALTARGAAGSSEIGPAPSPVASSFDSCPARVPLPFDRDAEANAIATAKRAVPLLSEGINATGFEITASNPATSAAAGPYRGFVASACGSPTRARTYVVEVKFPAMLPSASLSQRTLFLSRFATGWQVWGEYPPGPESGTSAANPTTSTPPTPGSTVDSIPSSSATGPVYLALGDSAPVWNGDASYPNYIAARYRTHIPGLQLVNLSRSGATTGSMLSASTGPSGSEQQQAVAFLQAHQRSVVLITIDIGGNDVLACGSGGTASSCVQRVEETMASNLTTILTQLRRAAGPTVPIVGMTYYDPYLGDWLAGGTARLVASNSVSYLVGLNNRLAKTYEAAGARVANVQGAFRSTDLSTYVNSPWGHVPIAVDRACTLLDMSCQRGEQTIGTDPNSAGAKVIAQAFETTIGTVASPR